VLALAVNVINLIPGTIVLEIDQVRRMIYVHVIDVSHEGGVVQFHTDPWPLPPDTIFGVGTIEGVTVRCVSRAAQLAMHSSYDLPETHRGDVRLLQGTA